MIGMKLQGLPKVKQQFLYDRRGNMIRHGLDKARHSRLSKAGSFVRTSARSKLNKTAKQKPVASLSRDERVRYYTSLALHNGKKVNRATWQMMSDVEKRAYFWERRQIVRGRRAPRRKPKRPLMAARRGEPPRKRTGLLRQFLFFAFDQTTRSVVVGPADLPGKKGDQPAALETGGRTVTRHGKSLPIHPHPYMAPSLAENQHKVPELFRDSI